MAYLALRVKLLRVGLWLLCPCACVSPSGVAPGVVTSGARGGNPNNEPYIEPKSKIKFSEKSPAKPKPGKHMVLLRRPMSLKTWISTKIPEQDEPEMEPTSKIEFSENSPAKPNTGKHEVLSRPAIF